MARLLGRSCSSLWVTLPEGRWKSALRGMIHGGVTWGARPRKRAVLINELVQLDVAEAGSTETGLRFIRLTDGPVFFKERRQETDRPYDRYWYLHGYLPEEARERIPRFCMDLAVDIVFRYVYPHADPTVRPPYSLADRSVFHLQHRDTIDDIPSCWPHDKEALKRRFAIRPGYVVIDVGAYLGFGAMRLCRMVGPAGKVIAVEAHPANQNMLLFNVQANGIKNLRLVPKAIWRGPGEMEFFCHAAQQNSLVEGVVAGKHVVKVPADSLDNVVREQRLDRVDLVSLTINGAEHEAIQGMHQTLHDHGPNLSIAGWYEQNGSPVYKQVTESLQRLGYQSVVGRCGRVYAWKTVNGSR